MANVNDDLQALSQAVSGINDSITNVSTVLGEIETALTTALQNAGGTVPDAVTQAIEGATAQLVAAKSSLDQAAAAGAAVLPPAPPATT